MRKSAAKPRKGNVQRPSRKGVGSSEPKRKAPSTGDEMVWSAWRHAAVSDNGQDLANSVEHTEQHYDLRRSTAVGEWQDIQKQALSANASSSNPILSGALGVYNGTILHESYRVYTAADGDSNADGIGRAVLCGAQAAAMAFGRGYSKNRMEWTEELNQYGFHAPVTVH